MKIKNCIFITISLFITIAKTAQAQPGTLDITFGIAGKVSTNLGGDEDEGYSVAIQNDGKIVVAGSTTSNGSIYDCALVRYNTDGTLDINFGPGGKIIVDFGSDFEDFRSVVIQSDGKIVVVGYSLQGTGSTANNDIILARFLSDGTLDNTFGTGGKVISDFGGGNTDEGYAVAIQNDGKIVVAGESNVNGVFDGVGVWLDMAVVRYNSNGTLDNTFGTSGIGTTDFGFSQNEYAKSIAIQSDGKIVIAGNVANVSPTYMDFAVARFNSDGTLDNSFDTDGQVTTDFLIRDDYASSICLQSDGKIVVAGYAEHASYQYYFALARYNSDGTLDINFGTGGKVTTAIGTYSNRGNSAAIQSDGKLVVGGSGYILGINSFALIRYNTNGTLDNTFDADGKVTTAFGSNDASGYSVAIQGDGKIVMAGNSAGGTTSSTLDFALARYNINTVTAITPSVRAEYMDIATYPNPTSGIFSIKHKNIHQQMNVEVYNMLGEKVLQQQNTNEINLSASPKGVYFLRIYDDKKSYTTKISVQ